MVGKNYWYIMYYIMYQYFSPFPFRGHGRKTCQGSTEIWTRIAEFRVQSANRYTMELVCCICTMGNPHKSVMGAASGIKAPTRFELMICCLLDRRFNQISHGASQCGELRPGRGQILCNYSTPPPPQEHAYMDTYTCVEEAIFCCPTENSRHLVA